MTAEIRDFTFEGKYTEADDAGGHCAVVQAYTREQALALAGMALIRDNEWDSDRYMGGDGHMTVEDFADLYEDEIDILHEWEGLDGSGCPNCTSHGGRDTGQDFAGTGGMIHECNSCGFQWVPLGKKIDPSTPTSEQIDAQIEAAWKQFVTQPWSCDNCGNTDQDGSDECVDCGQTMETEG